MCKAEILGTGTGQVAGSDVKAEVAQRICGASARKRKRLRQLRAAGETKGVPGAVAGERPEPAKKVQHWIYLEAPQLHAIPTSCPAADTDTMLHELCDEIVLQDFAECLRDAADGTESPCGSASAAVPDSQLPWSQLWQQLEAQGWVAVTRGAAQRELYLLPEHETVSSLVDLATQSAMTSRAPDGTKRFCLRTKLAVRQHYAATLQREAETARSQSETQSQAKIGRTASFHDDWYLRGGEHDEAAATVDEQLASLEVAPITASSEFEMVDDALHMCLQSFASSVEWE
jgi:hypothetical protein